MNLPEAFIERARIFAGEEYNLFLSSLDEVAPVSIRLNPNKLTGQFQADEKIPWSENGRYLLQRPSFTLDPLFHAGCYYVQEASSQFLERVFKQLRKQLTGPLRILDLCAAPGGKSTHLLSLMSENDLLLSNEIIPSRNSVLRENISKWGCANVIVTQNDPSDFLSLPGFFDIVLVDAPCSGEGLFRKDKEAIGEWSVENVNRCSVRQKEILSHAFNSLRGNGFLIYCTCTFEECENDEAVQSLLRSDRAEVIPIETRYDGIQRTTLGMSFFPHKIKGEGFYISLVQKEPGDNFHGRIPDSKSEKSDLRKHLINNLSEPDKFFPVSAGSRLFAVPKEHLSVFNLITGKLYVRQAGIEVGEVKGQELIPSESLALSNHRSGNLQLLNLGKEDALEYLRGNNLKINFTPGWTLAGYENHSLGWFKNLGTRINNYYPKAWRIRK